MRKIIGFTMGLIMCVGLAANAGETRCARRATAGRVATTAEYTCRRNTYRSVDCAGAR